VLDAFSRYILAWKLCTTMSATDVSDTLQVALQRSGLNQIKVLHRPLLLSDNGPSYVSGELGDSVCGLDEGLIISHQRESRGRSLVGPESRHQPDLRKRSGPRSDAYALLALC
jgi:transposase InsO family protein